MLAVTKMPHIEVIIKERIPKDDIKILKVQFSKLLKKYSDTKYEEEYIDIEETDWYREIGGKRSRGMTVKIYRENAGLSQRELGLKLGNFPGKYISDIENNRRNVSKEMAKKLSKLFKISIDRLM